MNRPLKYLLALLLAVASATASAGWSLGSDLTDFAWTDSDGRPLRLTALHAPVVVMTMAYTECRKVCGTTTLVLGDIQRRLDAMKVDAEFVVVSYDPGNDGPAEWRDYRARRHLDRGNWHFLTGDTVTTRKIARRLDLDFWTYHDHIVHDFRIVLFDAQWRAIGEVDSRKPGQRCENRIDAAQAAFLAQVIKLEPIKYAAAWTKKSFRDGLTATA
ncbi:MAG TPA: SCO family protein [Burkholderiaceae bacterium]|nr:SCO family protein [Burkholderiaceae bacterium]